MIAMGVGCSTFAEAPPPDYSIAPKSAGDPLGAPQAPAGISDGLYWRAPQGGETFIAGETYPLVWTGGDSSARVGFSLVRMDIWTVVPGAPAGEFANDGMESWTIPANLAPGDYEMVVGAIDRTDWRYSATFTVIVCGCTAK